MSELNSFFQTWITQFHQNESTDIYPHDNVKNQIDWLSMIIYHKSNTRNTFWITGIGKSGIVGQYFCQMLQSMGITSNILDPTNALHGDIGAVKPNDIVLFISKGGRNPEFINIIKSCQQRYIQTIAMCCNPDSVLVEHVGGLKNSVILPNPTEDSDWNVMPTTSILCFNYIVMLVINTIKKYKKLTKSEYYQYHPQGAIGELLQHRVKDVMKPLPKDQRLTLNSTLREALVYLTTHRLACCILIDEGGNLEGLFSDRDIREYLLSNNNPLEEPLSNIAHEAKITTTPDTELVVLAKHLETVDLKYLSGIPVIENIRGKNKVVGIINHKILLNHCKHLLK